MNQRAKLKRVSVQAVTLALRAYTLAKGGQRIWVRWAPDQSKHVISLPAGFKGLYDKSGYPASLATGANNIIINGPTYLILDCASLYRA